MTEDKRAGRVLVILTGGNIGLVVAQERNETVLRVATPEEFKKIVLNQDGSNLVRLREGSLIGREIHVEVQELSEAKERKYSDPEELDSAQVIPRQWAQIAEKIKEEYDRYEGFVVLHGLDTMAYSASALSFMLRNLQAPVIFTGSQRPLNFPRSDAIQNIFSALTLAASSSLGLKPIIREVCIYSYDTVFRGNRATMVSASSYRSYDSPNFPPLANVGEHIDVQSHLIRSVDTSKVLSVNPKVEAKVVILDVFPGMDADIIEGLKRPLAAGATLPPEQAASRPEHPTATIRGVVLRTYGMGTAPTAPSVLSALDKLNDAEIVVMNVTQARSGRISHGQDPVSLRLFEQGVISGVDMTAEAAYAKMVVYLSQFDEFGTVSDLLQLERCGEQSQSIFHIHFNANETREDQSVRGRVAFRAILKPATKVVNDHVLKNNIHHVSYIQLRLLGVEPLDAAVNRAIILDVELVDPNRAPNSQVFHLKNDLLQWSSMGRRTINMAYDITEARDQLLSRDSIPSTDIQLRTNEKIKWKRASIAIYTGVDSHAAGN